MRQTSGLPARVGDAMVFLYIDRTQSESGKEAPEIGGLRADSNYLTPKLGLLSADTRTVVALYIRNIVLNWSVFLPVFMAVLFIPRLFADSNESMHQSCQAERRPLADPGWRGSRHGRAGRCFLWPALRIAG
jgi:hypothetical protein